MMIFINRSKRKKTDFHPFRYSKLEIKSKLSKFINQPIWLIYQLKPHLSSGTTHVSTPLHEA